MYVDGVAIGHPVYNQSRSDIATLFPGRANTNGAVGYLQFDTRTLANGVHTIAWGVTDNAGNAEGIGSRYFTVLNGASSSILSSATVTNAVSLFEAPVREAAPSAGESVGQPVSALELVPVNDQPTYVQKGFEPGTPLEYVESRGRGRAARESEPRSSASCASPSDPPTSYEGDGYEGYMVKGSELAALPAGSFLDKKTGEFFWQPGPGFVG